MVNFGPLAVGFGSLVCGTPANFNKFRVLAALLHGTQPNCGIEQRAPPIFGRAAIMLGTGPHSRVSINKGCYFWFVSFVFLWFITGSFVWFLQDVIEPDFSCVKCRMWMKNGAIDSDPVFVSRPLYSFGVGSLMALTLILSSVAISVSGYCYFCVRSLLFLCQVTSSLVPDPLLAALQTGASVHPGRGRCSAWSFTYSEHWSDAQDAFPTLTGMSLTQRLAESFSNRGQNSTSKLQL